MNAAATKLTSPLRQRFRARAYQRVMAAMRVLHPTDAAIYVLLAPIDDKRVDNYAVSAHLRDKFRSEFDVLLEAEFLAIVTKEGFFIDDSAPDPIEPTEEEEAAALASIQEAMKELSVPKPTECGDDGGQGIGAGHVCKCVRPEGHPLDGDRPHGCSCGALWGKREPEPAEDPMRVARREAMDWIHGKDRPGGLDGRFAGPVGLVRAVIAEAEERISKCETGISIHDHLLDYLVERDSPMPAPETFPMLNDPDARLILRDHVMVCAVLAHHLGTSVEECLGLGASL